jgi:circadian clock protein KaiC
VSSFISAGTDLDARSMLMRLIDLLKSRQITALLTSLTGAGHPVEQSEAGISSLIDTWLMVRNLEQAGERTRTLSIIKSRGMKHSNQARELLLTDRGVDLAEVFIGPDGAILTGSLRVAQEAADRASAAALKIEIARKEHALMRRRKAVESRIAEMRADLAAEAEAVDAAIEVQTSAISGLVSARGAQAREREQSGAPQAGNSTGGRR